MDEDKQEGTLVCPKCHGSMETLSFEEIEIDRCTNCRGIFFDICEHEDLAKLAHEKFDEKPIGTQHGKSAMDAIRDIECPRCGDVKMLKLVAIGQSDVQYEKCPLCSGVYFDAGEFTDFETGPGLLNAIKAWLKG